MANVAHSKDLATLLESLKDAPEVSKYLAKCDTGVTSNPPPVFLIFPKFREDNPDIDALVEWLWANAVNYVVPLSKRKLAQTQMANAPSGADMSYGTRLVEEARRSFVRFKKEHPTRPSEVGELLAYIIALGLLKAAQVASKMALKTSGNMHVHGLDGIHASFSDGILTLFFLESKIAKTAAEGIKKYSESVGAFGNNRRQYLLEYSIVSDLSNLDALDSKDRQAALEYFDIYGAKKDQRLERSVGVICYSATNLYSTKLPIDDQTTPADHEQAFAKRFSNDHQALQARASAALTDEGVNPAQCQVFLVAIPDVDLLRKKFEEVMG